jgi:hypothetical protein
MEETRWEGQNFSEVVATQEEEEEEEECCALSGRGFCDELITRQEEFYRLWCVVVCDLENLVNEEAMTYVGS